MSKIYVVKKQSKTGNSYPAMVVDLGYRQSIVAVGNQAIAELCSISIPALIELLCNRECVEVGEIY